MQHPIRLVLASQGRRFSWLADQLVSPATGKPISVNYLHRILLGPDHDDGRAAPAWFYPAVARVLGVPESMLRPIRPERTERIAA